MQFILRFRTNTLVALLLCCAGFQTLSHAQDRAAGQRKAAACATCHGLDGVSTLPIAPHLAGQPQTYLVEQLKAYRDGKRVNDMMTLLAKPLSDADIADLAAWYTSFDIKSTPK
jgi:cytochrome c553